MATDPYNRVRYFLKAVENAREKLRRLEREAEEMRAEDLLTCIRAAGEAWDREAEQARLREFIKAVGE